MRSLNIHRVAGRHLPALTLHLTRPCNTVCAHRGRGPEGLEGAVDYAELLSAAVRSRIAYLDPPAVQALLSGGRRRRTLPTPWGSEADAEMVSEMRDVDPASIRVYERPLRQKQKQKQKQRPQQGRAVSGYASGTQAYLWTRGDGTRCLTFRGTAGIEDLLSSLDIRMRPIPLAPGGRGGGPMLPRIPRVHSGFLKQLETVWADVQWDIDSDIGQDRSNPISVCGHSLGGALATLAAVRLAAAAGAGAGPHRPVRCLTFGSPRVGDSAFAALGVKGWRVFNEGDPVPMLPDSRRFVHTPLGLRLEASGGATVGTDGRTLLECARALDPSAPLADHTVDRYVARLRALRDSPFNTF